MNYQEDEFVFDSNIAAIFRAKQAYKQYKQKDIADSTGISRSHLSRLLNGKNHFTTRQIVSIAECLDLEPPKVFEEAYYKEAA